VRPTSVGGIFGIRGAGAGAILITGELATRPHFPPGFWLTLTICRQR